MKYKVGDEVLVKGSIKRVLDNGIVFSCFCGEAFIHKEIIDTVIPLEKTYTQGLADAWELAKKLERMPLSELEKVFGLCGFYSVVQQCKIEEALAKIEAYEREKEIEPTDVAEYHGKKWVVVEVMKGAYLLWDGHDVITVTNTDSVKKVGSVESITPLAELLRQIGE